MTLKTWTPFPYLDTDWEIDLPWFMRKAPAFRPSIDVVRTDGKLVLTAELPGMGADDVDVSLDGNILTIAGEKTGESQTTEGDRYLHERAFGSFRRRIAFPDGVTADQIDATYENGVLTVRVDLREEKSTHHDIPVETTTS